MGKTTKVDVKDGLAKRLRKGTEKTLEQLCSEVGVSRQAGAHPITELLAERVAVRHAHGKQAATYTKA